MDKVCNKREEDVGVGGGGFSKKNETFVLEIKIRDRVAVIINFETLTLGQKSHAVASV
jgi:hypothetical protein